MNLFKGKEYDGDARRFRCPIDFEAIANGLEMEASAALNAVPVRAVVSVQPFGDPDILVNGRFSPALNELALYMGVDEVLDFLANNGRAVTTTRVGG